MSEIKAVDFGVYTHVPTVTQLDQMYNDGQRLAIIGLWHGTSANNKAQAQLARMKARMAIAGYAFPGYPNGPNARQSIQRAKAAAGPHWDDLAFLALDFEHRIALNALGVEIVVREAIDETLKLGKRPIIYSANWAWERFMHHTEFPTVPCWYAQYDRQAILGPPREPFGGFLRYVGKQYQGSTDYFGVNVDLNVFDEQWVKAEQEGEEDMLGNKFIRTANDPTTLAVTPFGYWVMPQQLEHLKRQGNWPDEVEIVSQEEFDSVVRTDK